MFRRKTVIVLAVTALVALGVVVQALSQEQGGQQGGRRGQQRDPAQMQQRMEQFRQRAATRMKEIFGASDDEWKVLQPKIEKVQTLARQVRGGMGMGMAGQRAGRGARPGGEQQPAEAPQRQQSDVEKAMSALQQVLQNKEATPEQIKSALTALRDARAKARDELEKAQKELREVVTVRQEAVCVTMGLLD
jgi:low affinity Fe/Cu permease